jgi:hypothetical protein
MVWKPGQSGNMNGRPRTSSQEPGDVAERTVYNHLKIEKIQAQYRAMAMAQHLIDPVLFQHQLLSDETIPKINRAIIAQGISNYYHPRLGVQAAPKYITTPIDIPDFASIEDAEDFLIKLAQREARQELDCDSVATASSRVLDWIHSKRQGQELEIKQAQSRKDDPTIPRKIIVEGGLPALPGTNVTMPQLNGHEDADLLIESKATELDWSHDQPPPGMVRGWSKDETGEWVYGPLATE